MTLAQANDTSNYTVSLSNGNVWFRKQGVIFRANSWKTGVGRH